MSYKRTTEQGMSEQAMSEQAMSEEELHEELSAFMDGELDADRARFLQQRLGHDAELLARWERWQLLSASMRRQGQPLPAGFADRVGQALAVPTPQAASVRNRALRWSGGTALAASLAVAGVFVFDAMHEPHSVPQVATTYAQPITISPIQRTVLTLPEPVIQLPIPVESGVVTAFRSPLHPVLLRQLPQRASFAPFPQPYPIDPELEAYLQRQKSGATHDVFIENGVKLPDASDSAVRTVAFPQDGQH